MMQAPLDHQGRSFVSKRLTRSVPCPVCGAQAGERCRDRNGPTGPHVERVRVLVCASPAESNPGDG